MQYKIGMYGGSFDPLHIGHMNVIVRAAAQCEKLFIVLSYSKNRDSVPMEYRYRWLRNSFKHLSNVNIILLEDSVKSKEEYDTQEYWEQGRDYVLSQIGEKVDVVFCGSDYKGTERYENLYQCEVVYYSRDEISIGSSEIRQNPFR